MALRLGDPMFVSSAMVHHHHTRHLVSGMLLFITVSIADAAEGDFKTGTKLGISEVVETDNVNLRSSASATSAVVAEVPQNTTGLMATGKSALNGPDHWIQVRFRSHTGWLNSRVVVEATTKKAGTLQEKAASGSQKKVEEIEATALIDPVTECNGADEALKRRGCTEIINDEKRSAEERAIAFSRRSDLHLAAQDVDSAISDRAKALELEPSSSEAKNRVSEVFRLRANSRQKNNDLDGALKDYSEAYTLDPGNFNCLAGQASIHARRGNFDGAIEALRKMLELKADNAGATFMLGKLLAQRATEHVKEKKLDLALLDYTAAVGADPSNAQLRLRKASVLSDQNRHQDAIQELTEALRIDPQLTVAYARRATTSIAVGDSARALADLEEVIKREPKDTSAFLRSALLYEQTNSYESATAKYNAALSIEPKNKAAREGLERLKRATADKGAILTPPPALPVKKTTEPTSDHDRNRACCLAYYRGERSLEGWGPSERCRRNMASMKANFCQLLKEYGRYRRQSE